MKNIIFEAIIKEEQEFPRLFASFEEREYGTFFYNEKIKDHHDSNHAIIYPNKINDLSIVLNEIKDFYVGKGIAPALYHPSDKNYFINNTEILKSCGYQFTITLDMRIMVLEDFSKKPVSDRLNIVRITSKNTDLNFIPDNSEYLKELYNNSIDKENHYIFTGFLNNEPVALVSFHKSKFDCTRFDEMSTAKKHRGKGFARDMNNFAVNFCMENNLPLPYQWPAHNTSARITGEAGFKERFLLQGGYANYVYEEHFSEE